MFSEEMLRDVDMVVCDGGCQCLKNVDVDVVAVIRVMHDVLRWISRSFVTRRSTSLKVELTNASQLLFSLFSGDIVCWNNAAIMFCM